MNRMQPVLVVKDRRFTQHLEGLLHLENPRRNRAFESIMENPSLEGRWREVNPDPATVEALARVHTRAYIQQVAQTAGKALTALDFDTQASRNTWETARLAAGGVCNLVDRLWQNEARRGFAFVRPPGHHALPDRAMGFCIFNNVALGARHLLACRGARKIMIVDIDAHHGNGTQTAFYDAPDVLFVSIHQSPAYPGSGMLGETGRGAGEGFTVNVPLGKGHGDRDYGRIIHFLVRPLARAYRPDMLLVDCGFDLYLYDRMGGMRVTPDGYALMTALLLEVAEEVCDGRIAFIAEGGYSMKGIRQCGLRVMQTLCGVPAYRGNGAAKIKRSHPSRFSVLSKVLAIQKKYWGSLSG